MINLFKEALSEEIILTYFGLLINIKDKVSTFSYIKAYPESQIETSSLVKAIAKNKPAFHQS